MGKATAHGKGVLSTLRSVYGADEYETEDTRAISERDGGTRVERASQNVGSLPSRGG